MLLILMRQIPGVPNAKRCCVRLLLLQQTPERCETRQGRPPSTKHTKKYQDAECRQAVLS